tara:strand:- start:4645 stop:6138 length:1494 start_codon:yes stop_codon:yes gene_type:complete
MKNSSTIATGSISYSSFIKEEERRRKGTFESFSCLSPKAVKLAVFDLYGTWGVEKLVRGIIVADDLFSHNPSPVMSNNLEAYEHKQFYPKLVAERPAIEMPVAKSSLDPFFESNKSSVKQELITEEIRMFCSNPKCGRMQIYGEAGVTDKVTNTTHPKSNDPHKCVYCLGVEAYGQHDYNVKGIGVMEYSENKRFELEMLPSDTEFVNGQRVPEEVLKTEKELEPLGWDAWINHVNSVTKPKTVECGCGFGNRGIMSEVYRLAHNKAVRVIGGTTIIKHKGKFTVKVWDINGKKIGSRTYSRKVFADEFEAGLKSFEDNTASFSIGTSGMGKPFGLKMVTMPIERVSTQMPIDILTMNPKDKDLKAKMLVNLEEMIEQYTGGKGDIGCGTGCNKKHFHTVVKHIVNVIPDDYWNERELAIANADKKRETNPKNIPTEEDIMWAMRFATKNGLMCEALDFNKATSTQLRNLTWLMNVKANPNANVEKGLVELVRLCGV